jgi:hypothetical protein
MEPRDWQQAASGSRKAEEKGDRPDAQSWRTKSGKEAVTNCCYAAVTIRSTITNHDRVLLTNGYTAAPGADRPAISRLTALDADSVNMGSTAITNPSVSMSREKRSL